MSENSSGLWLKFIALSVFFGAISVIMLVAAPEFTSTKDLIVYYGIFGGLGLYVLYHVVTLIIFMIKIRRRK
ncbi:MAG: hypothetical protein NTX82_03845 [Candidatus Parcubacteria bacterium]|nr:hypothetical protein [Candidatus Parcubacteria bacterium]